MPDMDQLPNWGDQSPTPKIPAIIDSNIPEDDHVIVIHKIQEAVRSPSSSSSQHHHPIISAPRLPSSPKVREKQRKISLPVVTSPLAAPSVKHVSFNKNPQKTIQRVPHATIRLNCIFGLCYFLMALTHLLFWVYYRLQAMTITYSFAALISLATTIWIYMASESSRHPHSHLFIALITKVAVSIAFSILGFINIFIDGFLYVNHFKIRGMGLWRKKQFALTNGALTLLELGLSIACCAIAVECLKQLTGLSSRSSSFRSSSRRSSRLPSVSNDPVEVMMSQSPMSDAWSWYKAEQKSDSTMDDGISDVSSSPTRSESSTRNKTQKSGSSHVDDNEPAVGDVATYYGDDIERFDEERAAESTGRETKNRTDRIEWEDYE